MHFMEFHIIPTGRVWVDPGGAFGLVPRALWIKHKQPDENQLLPSDLNSLLVFSEGKTILVDTGIGHKLDEKRSLIWGLEWPEGTLLENLAKHGVQPEQVDVVIGTHLHSDHCGGNTMLKDGKVTPTFPNATYMVQWVEWAEAIAPNVRTRATYLPENFQPVWQADQYQFMHGDTRITKHVRTVVTRGHTRAHQSVIVEGGETPLFFPSDLAGYAVQFEKAAWVPAYDVEPLINIATKQRWQAWAAENNALIIFQHDSLIRSARLKDGDGGKYRLEVLSAGSMKPKVGK